MSTEDPVYDASTFPAQLIGTETNSEIPVAYSDIYVWLCNKGVNKMAELVKHIWNVTKGGDMLQRKLLDDFCQEYTRYLTEQFKRYKTRLRGVQLLVRCAIRVVRVAAGHSGHAHQKLPHRLFSAGSFLQGRQQPNVHLRCGRTIATRTCPNLHLCRHLSGVQSSHYVSASTGYGDFAQRN
eukprot:TRINITY_DN5111_c0_g4_i3.p1 TRINITY_DN5111_c0_g4~~TRINITY_DN5111_c0_g4_i3.p1  ORF type:complete len:181 (-),score=0.45 TRINITY_DN5111_c0_g4_i3:614-1156(-)